MSIYRHDNNGNERVAIIYVDSAGNGRVTGAPIGAPNTKYINSNNDVFLLVIPYDQNTTEV